MKKKTYNRVFARSCSKIFSSRSHKSPSIQLLYTLRTCTYFSSFFFAQVQYTSYKLSLNSRIIHGFARIFARFFSLCLEQFNFFLFIKYKKDLYWIIIITMDKKMSSPIYLKNYARSCKMTVVVFFFFSAKIAPKRVVALKRSVLELCNVPTSYSELKNIRNEWVIFLLHHFFFLTSSNIIIKN